MKPLFSLKAFKGGFTALAFLSLVSVPVFALAIFDVPPAPLFYVDALVLQVLVGRFGILWFGVFCVTFLNIVGFIDRLAGAFHFDLVPFLSHWKSISSDMLLANTGLVFFGLFLICWFSLISYCCKRISPLWLVLFLFLIVVADVINGTSDAAKVKDERGVISRSHDISAVVSNRIRLQLALISSVEINASHLTQSDSAFKHYDPRTAGRSVVLVVVESLGLLRASSVDDDVLYGSLQVPDKLSVIASGVSPSHGSTVSGEIRELCGLVLYNPGVLDSYDECAIQSFKDRGYVTIAAHSYRKDFFKRQVWWPRVGFDRVFFLNDLADKLPICKGAFSSICDTDLMRWSLGAATGDGARPFLLYVLTSNTHLPLPKGRSLKNELRSSVRGIVKVFEEYVVSNGRTDVDLIIVGDHPPPMFGGSADEFVPRVVPWWIVSPAQH